MWKWMGLFLRKNHLLRCWGWPSPLNWIGALTLSLLLKLPPGKSEPWFVLRIFFLMRLLCISINLPYDHAWNTVAGAPSCYLELLQQKRMCKIVGPLLAASLEPLVHRQNVASLSLFCRYYFGRYLFGLPELVPLSYSREMSTRYSNRLHNFSIDIPRCYKHVYVNSLFPTTAILWNSLPIEYFPLTYDLNGLSPEETDFF